MRLARFVASLSVCSFGALAGCPLGSDLEAGPEDNVPRGSGNRVTADSGDDVAPARGDGVKPGGQDNETPDTPTRDRPNATLVPDDLAGAWRTVLTYVPAYYTWIIDPGDFTGSIGATYYFGADGQYHYDLNIAKTSFGGLCFRSSSWTEWGTLSVAGSQIALKAGRATNVVSDSCGEWVLDDNAPTADSTLGFTVEQDAAGWPMLRLRFPSGEEVVLERCRDCE